jgi:hypothetical protein
MDRAGDSGDWANRSLIFPVPAPAVQNFHNSIDVLTEKELWPMT